MAALASGCGSATAGRGPEPGPARSRRVVVVGAGLSGLVVADGLVQDGADVLVLEATERAGGRIATVRHWKDGLYVEAGATHVVGDPDLLALCKRLGVGVVKPARPKGLGRITLYGGRRLRTAPGAEPPSRFTLAEAERQAGDEELMLRYLGAARGRDVRGPWPPSDLTALDRRTIQAHLAERGASPGWIADYESSGLGEPDVSAAFVLRDHAAIHAEMAQGGGGRIEGGSDKLPAALAARLGKRIQYASPVKRIEQTAGGARVTFLQGGKLEHVDAERVVVAIPYSVLRVVELEPALPADKRRVVHELRMTSVTRIFQHVDERTWLADGDAGTADTDLPWGRLRDETELQPGAPAILGAYLSGEAARRASAMRVEDAVRVLRESIAKVHPKATQKGYGRGALKSWHDDPWQMGAYAYFAPGQLTELGGALARREGALHFAGCHTSYRPGFLHGALASATRVLAEVRAARKV